MSTQRTEVIAFCLEGKTESSARLNTSLNDKSVTMLSQLDLISRICMSRNGYIACYFERNDLCICLVQFGLGTNAGICDVTRLMKIRMYPSEDKKEYKVKEKMNR